MSVNTLECFDGSELKVLDLVAAQLKSIDISFQYVKQLFTHWKGKH